MAKLTTYMIVGVFLAIFLAVSIVDMGTRNVYTEHRIEPVNVNEPEVAEVKTIVSSEFPPGYNNPDVTELQKSAYFDTRLKDEYVQWTGTVSDVSMNGRNTFKLSVDHGSSMTSNALIRLADGQLENAITLKRGDTVTYTAKITRWGSFLGFYGEDGVIL